MGVSYIQQVHQKNYMRAMNEEKTAPLHIHAGCIYLGGCGSQHSTLIHWTDTIYHLQFILFWWYSKVVLRAVYKIIHVGRSNMLQIDLLLPHQQRNYGYNDHHDQQ